MDHLIQEKQHVLNIWQNCMDLIRKYPNLKWLRMFYCWMRLVILERLVFGQTNLNSISIVMNLLKEYCEELRLQLEQGDLEKKKKLQVDYEYLYGLFQQTQIQTVCHGLMSQQWLKEFSYYRYSMNISKEIIQNWFSTNYGTLQWDHIRCWIFVNQQKIQQAITNLSNWFHIIGEPNEIFERYINYRNAIIWSACSCLTSQGKLHYHILAQVSQEPNWKEIKKWKEELGVNSNYQICKTIPILCTQQLRATWHYICCNQSNGHQIHQVCSSRSDGTHTRKELFSYFGPCIGSSKHCYKKWNKCFEKILPDHQKLNCKCKISQRSQRYFKLGYNELYKSLEQCLVDK